MRVTGRRLLASAIALLVFPSVAAAQTERGTFHLHKFAQLIGEETYTITAAPAGLTLESEFKFTDRGTPVPLTPTLPPGTDYTPRSFRTRGRPSRFAAIDREITIDGRRAHVRDGEHTSDIA